MSVIFENRLTVVNFLISSYFTQICLKMPQPFYLLSFNQRRCGEKAKIAFHFDLKFHMENALFTRPSPAVTCVLKLFREGISQAKTTA